MGDALVRALRNHQEVKRIEGRFVDGELVSVRYFDATDEKLPARPDGRDRATFNEWLKAFRDPQMDTGVVWLEVQPGRRSLSRTNHVLIKEAVR